MIAPVRCRNQTTRFDRSAAATAGGQAISPHKTTDAPMVPAKNMFGALVDSYMGVSCGYLPCLIVYGATSLAKMVSSCSQPRQLITCLHRGRRCGVKCWNKFGAVPVEGGGDCFCPLVADPQRRIWKTAKRARAPLKVNQTVLCLLKVRLFGQFLGAEVEIVRNPSHAL